MIGLSRDEAGEGSAGRPNRTLFRSLQNLYSLGFFDLSHQAKLIFLPVEIGPIPTDINRLYFAHDDGGAMLRQKSRIGCGKAFRVFDRYGAGDAGASGYHRQISAVSGLARRTAAAAVQMFVIEGHDTKI